MKKLLILLLLAGCEKPVDYIEIKKPAVKESLTTQKPEYVTVRMNVSAYCNKSCCCGEFADGFTASGKPASGFLVAAPKNYPYGTEISIPGYAGGKWVKVEDRGGAIKGNRIDLLFDDKDGVSGHDRAIQWGRQYLDVRVRVN